MNALYGIILSAGKARRLKGKVKALLRIKNRTFIEEIISNLEKAGVKNIFIVLGYKADAVKKYLRLKNIPKKGTSLKILINNNYNSQQLTSLKLAVKNLPKNCEGIIFTPVDHPLVKLSTYKKLLSYWKKDKNKICIPSYNHRKGHPAVFPRKIFEKILTEKLPGGARSMLEKYPKKVKYAVVRDPGTVNDFDSMADFQKYGLEENKNT